MARVIRLGTRRSPLALKQVDELLALWQPHCGDIVVEVIPMVTCGDIDTCTPITEFAGGDFFTREIDNALLQGRIDMAVHSAKDLPEQLPAGLMVAAVTESIAAEDVLVAKKQKTLAQLPPGAKLGTSSTRRQEQLKKYRDDFVIVDIRGNIGERLALLDNSDLDGIVIAAAGLLRLGLADRISERIPFSVVTPHPLQGALAVVVRTEDTKMRNVLAAIDTRT